MRIGIAGYGIVGKALGRFFRRSPLCEISIYDKLLDDYNTDGRLDALNHSDIVFIAVPTPNIAGVGCNITIVSDLIDRITAPICIKSTIPPGTTDGLIQRTHKSIAVSPEYIGESPGHPWVEIDDCGFAVVGGDQRACDLVVRTYELASASQVNVVRTSATTAELLKYMENCFLATKVAFVNQFYDLAASTGVDYAELRRLFLLDRRVGSSHTDVTSERGFSGKCLPKDLQAITVWAHQRSGAPLLEAIARYNELIRRSVPNNPIVGTLTSAEEELIPLNPLNSGP